LPWFFVKEVSLKMPLLSGVLNHGENYQNQALLMSLAELNELGEEV
jgi:hypothetical protein